MTVREPVQASQLPYCRPDAMVRAPQEPSVQASAPVPAMQVKSARSPACRHAASKLPVREWRPAESWPAPGASAQGPALWSHGSWWTSCRFRLPVPAHFYAKAARADHRSCWALPGHRFWARCRDGRHADRQRGSLALASCCCRHCLRLPTCGDGGDRPDDHGDGAGCCRWRICFRRPDARCCLQRGQPRARRPVAPWCAACRLPLALAREPDVMRSFPCPCPCRRRRVRCVGWIPVCPGFRHSCDCGRRCSCVRHVRVCRIDPGRNRAGSDRPTGRHFPTCRCRLRCGCLRCDASGRHPSCGRTKRRVGGCLRRCAHCLRDESRHGKRCGVPFRTRFLRRRWPYCRTTRTGAKTDRRPSSWRLPWIPWR